MLYPADRQVNIFFPGNSNGVDALPEETGKKKKKTKTCEIDSCAGAQHRVLFANLWYLIFKHERPPRACLLLYRPWAPSPSYFTCSW